MDPYWLEWFEVLFRWLHLLVGVAWIGSSLHFVRVDRGLEPDEGDPSVQGRFWAIHGGGVYQFTKFNLAPKDWPTNLHWSKWEAYTTWMTGITLLVLIYYVRADVYLMAAGKPLVTSGQAIAVSLVLIIGGVGIYEALIRSRLAVHTRSFAVLVATLILGLCWLADYFLASRAAFIHVGVVLGSIMVGNVFFGIIPAQKAFVAAVQQGQAPDQAITQLARQRSFFNNYLTLPVLLCMISLHFSTLYQNAWGFLGLFTLMLAGAIARHFFNLRHLNIVQWRYLVVPGLMALIVMLLFRPPEPMEQPSTHLDGNPAAEAVERIQVARSEAEIDQLVLTHCGNCHATQPSHPGFSAPPGGLLFENHQDLLAQRARAASAIGSGYMPLGNSTGFEAADRRDLMEFLIGSQ